MNYKQLHLIGILIIIRVQILNIYLTSISLTIGIFVFGVVPYRRLKFYI